MTSEERAQVLECGRPKTVNLVQKAMAQHLSNTSYFLPQMRQVDEHPRLGIGLALQSDRRLVRMPMDTEATFGLNRSMQCVRGLEVEPLRQFADCIV